MLGRRSYFPYGVDVSTAGHYDDRICKFTGHERDVHNTTDYMMARSYAYPIQRFTSPDPGRDGWNLYAYVGNNPMNRVDPDGLELRFVGDAVHLEQVEDIANSGLFNQRLEINNGVAQLVSTGEEGPALAGQAALADVLSQAINDPGTTTIGVTSGSAEIHAGSFIQEAIDVSDIRAFGSGPGPSAQSVLGHEVTEQFAKQALGMREFTPTSRPAHQLGIAAQDRISGWIRGETRGSVAGGATSTDFSQRGRSISVTTRWSGGNVESVWRYRR